jgi:hypothetical protein
VLYSLVLASTNFPAMVVITHPPQLPDSQPCTHTHFILAYSRAEESILARVLPARLRVAALVAACIRAREGVYFDSAHMLYEVA